MARLDELERKFEESPHRYFASLANEYRKGGEPQRAADMCRTQLAAIPGHISGHIVLGQALYDSGDFEESRTALERALTLDPENIVALRYLGDIARDTGDVPGAERWYARTLEADPYNEAATAALQAIREPAQVDAPEIAGTPSAEAAAIEPAAIVLEPTSLVEDDATTDWYAPEPSDVPESADVIETADTVDANEETRADYPHVTEPAPETSAERVSEETFDPAPAAAPEPAAVVEAVVDEEAQLESEQEISPEAVSESADFAGDLEISAASESAEPTEMSPAHDAAALDFIPENSFEIIPEELPVEPVDVAAHPLPAPVSVEELIQTEERVMESAAPFVTETMADLYLEQGYPHEALELLLQLSEQRPEDAPLLDKIESIKSVIAARRDAAVAAARAERAEAAETDATAEPAEIAELVAAQESTTLAVEPLEEELPHSPEPPAFLPQPRSVRELFARMDGARPRGSQARNSRAPSRLRSDFVPLPDSDPELQPADDPFGFPDAQPAPPPLPPAEQPSILPRTSGPHPTFDPSTAELADFDAWLRGLRGP
ncbi:MAG TPA: tetratricopeptide repeat protein [Gemmatimonadaceae bacterium]|nr:tetratricopeptide repeat protein [Gemmatimonadaceae bacterium]